MTTRVDEHDDAPQALTCAHVRQQLPDLVGDRLDERSATALRTHLMDCDACADALEVVVAEDVAQHPEPRAPYVPPIELYDAFQRARVTRFGTIWKSVRDAIASTDAEVRAWGEAQRAAIGSALEALQRAPQQVPPFRPAGVAGAVRTRGAVTPRQRQASRGPTTMIAEVVNSDSVAVGGAVVFIVDEPPHITAEGRLRSRMHTDATGYAGQIVLCTIDLGGGQHVSFTGVVTADEDAHLHRVVIDEAVAGVAAGEIPIDRITLFLTRP